MVGLLGVAHGVFYLITGLWPLLHMPSFLRVTGPKQDLWLVRAIGGLLVVIGLILICAGLRETATLEIFMLAIGTALVLGAVDITYVLKGVISRIYLADAVVELGLGLGWTALWFGSTH